MTSARHDLHGALRDPLLPFVGRRRAPFPSGAREAMSRALAAGRSMPAYRQRFAADITPRVAKAHTLCDYRRLDSFNWSTAKNLQLIAKRGISFERIVSAIEQGGLLDVVEHPNRERYAGQMIYVVEVEGYVHLVPFVPFVVEADGTRFLKTVIPSRKATRDHRRRQS